MLSCKHKYHLVVKDNNNNASNNIDDELKYNS